MTTIVDGHRQSRIEELMPWNYSRRSNGSSLLSAQTGHKLPNSGCCFGRHFGRSPSVLDCSTAVRPRFESNDSSA